MRPKASRRASYGRLLRGGRRPSGRREKKKAVYGVSGSVGWDGAHRVEPEPTEDHVFQREFHRVQRLDVPLLPESLEQRAADIQRAHEVWRAARPGDAGAPHARCGGVLQLHEPSRTAQCVPLRLAVSKLGSRFHHQQKWPSSSNDSHDDSGSLRLLGPRPQLHYLLTEAVARTGHIEH